MIDKLYPVHSHQVSQMSDQLYRVHSHRASHMFDKLYPVHSHQVSQMFDELYNVERKISHKRSLLTCVLSGNHGYRLAMWTVIIDGGELSWQWTTAVLLTLPVTWTCHLPVMFFVCPCSLFLKEENKTKIKLS